MNAFLGISDVGLALYAAVHGYEVIFVVPDNQSIEKINNLSGFGAKVKETPTNLDRTDQNSYYSDAKRLSGTVTNSF